MTAKEALNNIATISEILVEVSKSHIMSNKAINEIRKLDIGEIYFILRQALTELEAIKSVDGGEALKVFWKIAKGYEERAYKSQYIPDKDYEDWEKNIIDLKNYILKAQAQERELSELKANQMKVKTIEGYGVDDILVIIQGLQSKEITPEILHNNLLMYKKGYEEALEQINKGWEDFNSRLMKMDKGSEE